MTSVSVSEVNSQPAAFNSRRSSSWFSMMPLCTSATLPPTRMGWALRSLGTPWVAQRVWAMPQ